ncbi:predicted protein [Nematostella vectensis]|uniref:ACT domain-containing protein n=1 Tax=Nematostella vectensis TaxID=45351 RepID=A7RTQ6_NEMVE|nr:predicted protein [Nematostella vectensis]|eukprot:XP_001637193.1 predicted protein [Nematostella vectensis]
MEESKNSCVKKVRNLWRASNSRPLVYKTSAITTELQRHVCIPLCGGNIDPTVVGRCIERGLASDGRLVRFIITISDRPGGMARLVGVLASAGANIKDIFHERAWLRSSVFKVQCKVIVEVRDREHGQMLRTLLEKTYDDVHWNTDHTSSYTG